MEICQILKLDFCAYVDTCIHILVIIKVCKGSD
jgi:hypothetical protein